MREHTTMKGKMRLKLAGVMAALTMWAGLALAQTAGNNFYLKSAGTNWPPLPENIWPGYPVEQMGWMSIVDDTISDAAVLGRGMQMMEWGEDEYPGPGPAPTNPPPAEVDLGWIGTFIRGVDTPRDPVSQLPASREPALWVVQCTNAGMSEIQHVHTRWHGETKVCPGDVVTVLYPYVCSGFTNAWDCFMVIQRGTNQYGQNWTNAFRMQLTSAGDRGEWTIPAWPDLSVQNGTGVPYCTNYPIETVTDDPCWEASTNTPSTNTDWLPCPELEGTGGSMSPTADGEGGIFPPSEGNPDVGNRPSRTLVDTSGVPGKGWWTISPTYVSPPNNPIWPFDAMCRRPQPNDPVGGPAPQNRMVSNNSSSTNDVTLVWWMQIKAHGRPWTHNIVESSTNMVDWAQEGDHDVVFGDEGRLWIVIGRTNEVDIPPGPFYLRLNQLGNQ
jgi:hypothetical protein